MKSRPGGLTALPTVAPVWRRFAHGSALVRRRFGPGLAPRFTVNSNGVLSEFKGKIRRRRPCRRRSPVKGLAALPKISNEAAAGPQLRRRRRPRRTRSAFER